MITQKDAVRELLKENPNILIDEAINLIKERYRITIPPSIFYSVRSDMGYGARRNGRSRITADSVKEVKQLIASTHIEGFASTLLEILDQMGYATFKESLKIVSQLEKS